MLMSVEGTGRDQLEPGQEFGLIPSSQQTGHARYYKRNVKARSVTIVAMGKQ